MMNENKAIFQVLTNDSPSRVLGTAFGIKTFQESNRYYLLTAYHVISELEAKGRPIIVQDEAGNFMTARKIFPSKLSAEYRMFGQDYGMLEIYSDQKYQTFELAVANERSDCFVRGAIPHYRTIFTSIDGRLLGEESIEGEKKVLQLKLETSLIFDEENKAIPTQKILRGLSGAPVLAKINDEWACVGVLGNLEGDRTGSLQYAVPMRTIVKDCLEYLNIPYSLQNEKKENNNWFREQALIELAIGDTEEFVFSEEKLELEAWNKLSNLFYKGNPVERILKELIESEIFYNYNSEVRCAILYFYARLLFKCSKNMLAFQAFHNISELLNEVSAATKIKLEALINSRSSIEKKIELPQETLNGIRYAGEKIIHLPQASDEYVANELASMYGRGLTNLFSVKMDYSSQEKEDLSKIYLEHKSLLEKNPIKLCKQDVVNTSLQWYLGYWNVSKEFDLQTLSIAVNNGFIQSKKRKNSIFYIQSMISYGILCAFNNETVQAVKAILLGVKLMHKEKIRLGHEGVKQLLLILQQNFLVLYAIFEMAYSSQTEQEFFAKASLLQIDLGIRSWEGIFGQVNELYTIKYTSNNTYAVEFEDIKIFL